MYNFRRRIVSPPSSRLFRNWKAEGQNEYLKSMGSSASTEREQALAASGYSSKTIASLVGTPGLLLKLIAAQDTAGVAEYLSLPGSVAIACAGGSALLRIALS